MCECKRYTKEKREAGLFTEKSRERQNIQKFRRRKKKRQEYRETHKEEIREQREKYYEANKERFIYTCQCGAVLEKKNRSGHERTEKHIIGVNPEWKIAFYYENGVYSNKRCVF